MKKIFLCLILGVLFLSTGCGSKKVNKVYVDYKEGEVEGKNQQEIAYTSGQKISDLEIPTLYGYKFTAWYQEGTNSPIDEESVLYDGLKLIATYSPITVNISVNVVSTDQSVTVKINFTGTGTQKWSKDNRSAEVKFQFSDKAKVLFNVSCNENTYAMFLKKNGVIVQNEVACNNEGMSIIFEAKDFTGDDKYEVEVLSEEEYRANLSKSIS